MIGAIESVGYKFDRWLDTVIMQRTLGEGATTPPKDVGAATARCG
jgi:phosphinothricin acetyltransferase